MMFLLAVDPDFQGIHMLDGTAQSWTTDIKWVFDSFLPPMFSTPAGVLAVSVLTVALAAWTFFTAFRIAQRYL